MQQERERDIYICTYRYTYTYLCVDKHKCIYAYIYISICIYENFYTRFFGGTGMAALHAQMSQGLVPLLVCLKASRTGRDSSRHSDRKACHQQDARHCGPQKWIAPRELPSKDHQMLGAAVRQGRAPTASCKDARPGTRGRLLAESGVVWVLGCRGLQFGQAACRLFGERLMDFCGLAKAGLGLGQDYVLGFNALGFRSQ